MEKIVKVIDGLIHTSGCNLQCSYCYIRQMKLKNDKGNYALKYPLEIVLAACSKERLGGAAFSI